MHLFARDEDGTTTTSKVRESKGEEREEQWQKGPVHGKHHCSKTMYVLDIPSIHRSLPLFLPALSGSPSLLTHRSRLIVPSLMSSRASDVAVIAASPPTFVSAMYAPLSFVSTSAIATFSLLLPAWLSVYGVSSASV